MKPDPDKFPWRLLLQVGLTLVVALGLMQWFLTVGLQAVLPNALVNTLLVVTAALAGTAAAYRVLRAERQMSRAAILSSQTLQTNLLNALPVGIFFKDAQGRYTGCNQYFSSVMGIADADLRGKTVMQLWPSDLAQTYHQKDLDLMHHGKVQQYEYRLVDKDGHTREVLYTKGPLLDENNAVSGLVGAFIDISEQKQAETQLAASQRLLDSIIEHIPNMIFLKRAQDLRFVLFNRAGEQLLGLPRQDVLGKSDFDFYPTEQAEFFVANDRAVLASPEVLDFEAEIINSASQGQRVLHTKKLALRNAQGQPEYLLGISEDITQSRHVDNELKRHRDELQTLVAEQTQHLTAALQRVRQTELAMNNVGIGITWVDFETARFVYASEFACQLLGYSAAEMLQLTVHDIDPNFPQGAYRAFCEQIRAQGQIHFETQQQTRDGKLCPVEMSIFYLDEHAQGKPTLIAFNTDISRRKADELELRRSKEQAEAANLAKSEFLANMSHEIRTPLNAVLGLAFLLQKEALMPSQKAKLAKITVSGQHLLSMFNDILDLSKVEAGKLALEMGNLHLSSVVDNVASMVRESAYDKGLQLRVLVEHDGPWLRGDITRLCQALLNLANNAVKFTAHGSVQIQAKPVAVRPGAVRVRFEVQDTGIGLSQAQQGHLFQDFSQADGSISRKYGGTGLGLSLTQKLVHLMGGEVGVISQEGQGSTFWFELDLGLDATTTGDQSLPDSPHNVDDQLRRRFAGARILLVEDDPISIEVMLELLQDVQLSVTAAMNGREALELARGGHFDLVLMDLQMPEMTGIDATKAIRQLPGWSDVPILALTANVLLEDQQACLQAGMNATLIKPVEPLQLYDTVIQYLSAVAQHEKSAHAPPDASLQASPDARDMASGSVLDARSLIEPLLTLLTQSDLDVIDYVEQHAAALQHLFGDEFKLISRLIQAYDFEAAQQRILRWL